MCLSTVDKTEDEILSTGVGYKVFEYSNNHKKMYPAIMNGSALRMKVWLKADTSCVLRASDNSLYKSGFHIFKRKKDALMYLSGSGKASHVICKVEYREAFCEGLQSVSGVISYRLVPCVIASEMKVVEKFDK